MKIVRVLVYEGDEKWINETLGSSVGNGINYVGPERSITSVVVRPEDTEVNAQGVKELLEHINTALNWDTEERIVGGRIITT